MSAIEDTNEAFRVNEDEPTIQFSFGEGNTDIGPRNRKRLFLNVDSEGWRHVRPTMARAVKGVLNVGR